ncbi:MAG: hypothetical protein JWR47_1843 [Phenylobacterium sp.]|nr:hypothetical protein [Phenylobacterium sp.]
MPVFNNMEGASFHTDRVRFFRKDYRHQTVLVTFDDDSLQTLPLHLWERLERTWFQHILPAAPATYLLTTCCDEDDHTFSYSKEPVIAWGVTQGGSMTAITAEGADEYGHAILMPSGVVLEQQIAEYASLEAYEEEKRRSPH